jgi:hypothetical protein
MMPTSERGGSTSATGDGAAAASTMLPYLSTSFMRALNQFMKAEVVSDNVK